MSASSEPIRLLCKTLFLFLITNLTSATNSAAQPTYEIPASQLTGCPWDASTVQNTDIVVKNSKIRAGGAWLDISGVGNEAGFIQALNACGMSESQSAFKAWRSHRRGNKWGVVGGSVTLGVYATACTLTAIYTSGIFGPACLNPMSLSLPITGAVGLGLGLKMKPKHKRAAFAHAFKKAMRLRTDGTNQPDNSLDPLIACTDLKPTKNAVAKERVKACQKVRTTLDDPQFAQSPLYLKIKRLENVWATHGTAETCETASEAWSEKELNASIQACTEVLQGWESYSTELTTLKTLSKERANFLRDLATKRLRTPTQQNSGAAASSKCAQVWDAFGSSSQKSQNDWLNCCEKHMLSVPSTGEAPTASELKSMCD